MSELNSNIKVKGIFNIKTIDAVTGKILEEETGDNLVLNTGLDFIRRAISSSSVTCVSHLQLGADATAPTSSDGPKLGYTYTGLLDQSPSEVLPVQAFYFTDGKVTFKCIVPSNSSNGSSVSTEKTYTEAVLLIKPVLSTEPYIWFARKTFTGKTKSTSVLFEINWDINFTYTS